MFLFVVFQWRPQAIVFEIVTDKKFDMIIMLFIGFNMLTMTLDHYQQSETFSGILDYLNMIFIVIFSSECLMKIFALRYHYFVEPWNLFDFVVVILSILGEHSGYFYAWLSTTNNNIEPLGIWYFAIHIKEIILPRRHHQTGRAQKKNRSNCFRK